MSISLESKIEFQDLCRFFENVKKSKGLQKCEDLRKFISYCRNVAAKIKAENATANISYFPIFRLIMPNLERERGPYGFKFKTLSSLYVTVFCLGKNSDNAKKLMHPKAINGATRKYDDLGESVYWVMKGRMQSNKSSLTIEQVNKFLDNVAQRDKMGQSKVELFTHFTRHITALELKWLTCILLKELKLGLIQKKIFEVIHPDAEDLYNTTSSLRRVCELLEKQPCSDIDLSLGRATIELFSHVKPMLLERLKIEHIGRLFTEEDVYYYVQTKYDGERSQLHMRHGTFKYFTRQGHDITGNPSYGETINSGGFLTKNITPLLNEKCYSIILDGELMGWHKERKNFGSKGLNYDVKKLTVNSRYQPCFVAYDILLYNDDLYVDKPYSERLECLKSAFKEKEDVLILGKTSTVTKVEQVMDIFNTALENDDEGIVIKRFDCLYRPNVREKSGCYKIKAEFSDDLVQDLDLIILGGYYGRGRCSGLLSSFLVGVAGSSTNSKGEPTNFFAVVSVKSGLSGKNLQLIQEKLKEHWKDIKPQNITGPKAAPDKWMTPKHSIILKLRASEIIRTDTYPLGYSLRFPRVQEVKDEKPWYNACSITEFMKLVKDGGGVQKLTKRKATVQDIEEVRNENEPKLRKVTRQGVKVHESFLPARKGYDEVTRISRLFHGKEFCVINGDEQMPKKDVEIILQRHSAKVLSNFDEGTFCILVGNPETQRAINVIKAKKYDVANLAWLRRATMPENFSKIADFYPWELYSACPATKHKLKEMYDEYWDSYTDDIDDENFERSSKRIKEKMKNDFKISDSDIKKLDRDIFDDGIAPCAIFRGINGYFYNPEDINAYDFSFMNGKISEELNQKVNYVFIDNGDVDVLRDHVENIICANSKEKILILQSKWIRDCFESQKLLPIENYIA